MMAPDHQQHQCRSCTVPAANSPLDPVTGLCSFCADPPPTLCPHNHPLSCDCPCPALDAVVAPVLLAEVDQQLALEAPITDRMAHACTAFPLTGGWSCYVTDVDGNRITISATRRDPETRTVVNREFVATIVEVA